MPAWIHPWHLRRAAMLLRRGGVLAYPTEAVYGLGCDPLNPDAVERLLELKRRPVEKGLLLIACAPSQLAPFVLPLDSGARARVDATWPGPVTWLLPARPEVPVYLRGAHDTVAVRVTAHPVAAALCREVGFALVSTSANLSGRRPARDLLGVRRQFGDALDGTVPGAVGGRRHPTEIRDLRTGRTVRGG